MNKSLNTSPSGNTRMINLRYIPLTSDEYRRDQPWVTTVYRRCPETLSLRLLFMHRLGSSKHFIFRKCFIHIPTVNKDIDIQLCALDTFME